MQTQPEDQPTAEDNVVVASGKALGRIAKNMTVATGEDGGRMPTTGRWLRKHGSQSQNSKLRIARSHGTN